MQSPDMLQALLQVMHLALLSITFLPVLVLFLSIILV
jgi:hypothetical protein